MSRGMSWPGAAWMPIYPEMRVLSIEGVAGRYAAIHPVGLLKWYEAAATASMELQGETFTESGQGSSNVNRRDGPSTRPVLGLPKQAERLPLAKRKLEQDSSQGLAQV